MDGAADGSPAAYPASLRPPAVENPTTIYSDLSQALTTSPALLQIYIPDGTFSNLRLRGVLAKADAATTTLTVAIETRPPSGTSYVAMSSTDIDVEGAGPDSWVGVNASLPAPDTGANGNLYRVLISVSSSTATLHGPVILAEV
jgi:hypothetical protein